MTSKIHSISYSDSTNLGDEIQAIAAVELIQKLGHDLEGFIDRCAFDTVGKYNVLINGFLHYSRLYQLFQGNVNPIISNLHIDWSGNPACTLQTDIVEKLKEYGTIGCRDRYTMAVLRRYGIDCVFNYCLTLTLPQRKTEVQDGKIFLVDLDRFLPLPKSIKESSKIVRLTHGSGNIYSHNNKMQLAQGLLDRYRNEAELVITARLHCALPCLAMGIPVIFFGNPKDERLKLVAEFIPIYPYYQIYPRYPRNRIRSALEKLIRKLCNYIIYNSGDYYQKQVYWTPLCPNINPLKENIISNTNKLIQSKLR